MLRRVNRASQPLPAAAVYYISFEEFSGEEPPWTST
jgi:hypothetical protein